MDTLDKPINLSYHNGKVFPTNVVFMGYVLLAVSVFALLTNYIIGIPLLLVAVFITFTWNGVVIHPETKSIKDYTAYLGFIKLGKTIDCKKFQFVTVIPTKQSNTIYANATMSTNQTDYFFAICLLNKNYRNKTEITKFQGKGDSTEIAKQLAFRLEMEYFEYDPKVIREKLLGR